MVFKKYITEKKIETFLEKTHKSKYLKKYIWSVVSNRIITGKLNFSGGEGRVFIHTDYKI